jgi:hypothetical protein
MIFSFTDPLTNGRVPMPNGDFEIYDPYGFFGAVAQGAQRSRTTVNALGVATAVVVAAPIAADAVLSVGVQGTIHGAMRMAEAARLTPFAVFMTKILATAKYTQSDGAVVFVREVAGKFNVVIQNPMTGRVITVFKNLSTSSLAKLADKFGWH